MGKKNGFIIKIKRYFRMKTKRSIPRQNKTKKRGYVGGKSTSDGGHVSLHLKTELRQSIVCDICKQNDYEEVIGTTNKSKVRDMVGSFIFGEGIGNIDNTSIIQYFCNGCGYCKIFRNKDPLKYIVTKIK
jgi:hypothetical protein